MDQAGKTRIAVIVEDQRLQDYIVLLLVGEGYEVKAFSTQHDALKNLEREMVDLIISDFHSPNINGLDICKVLRKNFSYNLVPMFFLIPDKEPLNAARLIYAGADDYIKKSLIEEELFLKVKLNLYRTTRHLDINNSTRLPGQTRLFADLKKLIDIKESFAVSYVQLHGFKELNYRYGFERGEAALKYTGMLILKTLRELGVATDFLAQTQTNDFVYITSPETVDEIGTSIVREFDQGIVSFYDPDDRLKGCILIKNRFGEIQKAPLLKIHIGAVTNAYLPLFAPARIVQIASEIKDLAKKNPEQSAYVKEERKNYTIS